MIVFVHPLNDSSGSPRVLLNAISALVDNPSDARLIVGGRGNGILDHTKIPRQNYWYHRSRFRAANFFTFFASQFVLFYVLARDRSIPKGATIYINTLLPFAAAIWGRATGRRVVFHLHEVSLSPLVLQHFLVFIARLTADRLIYVSADHKQRLPIGKVPQTVIGNPVDPKLQKFAETPRPKRKDPHVFRILMLASLRNYKGIPEFFRLARTFIDDPGVRFTLVLNCNRQQFDDLKKNSQIPANVELIRGDPHPETHYQRADLLVNLSRVDQWIETFGLTLIEAMTFGIPVIAPPIGGPSEIVSHGQDGFLIDSRNHQDLCACIGTLMSEPKKHGAMSKAAKTKAKSYRFDIFSKQLNSFIKKSDSWEDSDEIRNCRDRGCSREIRGV